jgi:hypothetical protein
MNLKIHNPKPLALAKGEFASYGSVTFEDLPTQTWVVIYSSLVTYRLLATSTQVELASCRYVNLLNWYTQFIFL